MAVDTNPEKIKGILERGVEEIFDKSHLEKALKSGKKLRVKLGIDPTGPKIHIGRAIVLWKLRAFQELGHQIVLIIGDFTGQIGDASDKNSMRKCLTGEEIAANMKSYQQQIGLILDMEKVELKYNSEWLGRLRFKEILGLTMHFTAQQMIQRRNFKERWENANPIGLHELLYPLMQGYDSVAVRADIELGGLDQLFNLKAGKEIQRLFNQPPQDIMTLKMLNGLDGRKMSTSWGNVINITEKANEMYGKVMSMQDGLLGDYYELCTRTPPEEVADVREELRIGKINPRDIKAALARKIVALYHGERKSMEAEEEFNRVFREKELPSEMPIFKAKKINYQILELLFEAGLANSKGEAKRLVLGRGVKINDEVKADWKEEIILKPDMIIQIGKRKFKKVNI